MLRFLSHLGYEGDRHTGRYGFGGRWASGRRPVDALQYHTGGAHPPHFVTTRAGWESLRRVLSSGVIQRPSYGGATADLGGGYDGLSVFVDECPCGRAPMPRDLYSFLPEFTRRAHADDVAAARAEYRAAWAMTRPTGLGPITGGQS